MALIIVSTKEIETNDVFLQQSVRNKVIKDTI